MYEESWESNPYIPQEESGAALARLLLHISLRAWYSTEEYLVGYVLCEHMRGIGHVSQIARYLCLEPCTDDNDVVLTALHVMHGSYVDRIAGNIPTDRESSLWCLNYKNIFRTVCTRLHSILMASQSESLPVSPFTGLLTPSTMTHPVVQTIRKTTWGCQLCGIEIPEHELLHLDRDAESNAFLCPQCPTSEDQDLPLITPPFVIPFGNEESNDFSVDSQRTEKRPEQKYMETVHASPSTKCSLDVCDLARENAVMRLLAEILSRGPFYLPESRRHHHDYKLIRTEEENDEMKREQTRRDVLKNIVDHTNVSQNERIAELTGHGAATLQVEICPLNWNMPATGTRIDVLSDKPEVSTGAVIVEIGPPSQSNRTEKMPPWLSKFQNVTISRAKAYDEGPQKFTEKYSLYPRDVAQSLLHEIVNGRRTQPLEGQSGYEEYEEY